LPILGERLDSGSDQLNSPVSAARISIPASYTASLDGVDPESIDHANAGFGADFRQRQEISFGIRAPLRIGASRSSIASPSTADAAASST
jgi:hypothetical protein